jgi:hypothetical protein
VRSRYNGLAQTTPGTERPGTLTCLASRNVWHRMQKRMQKKVLQIPDSQLFETIHSPSLCRNFGCNAAGFAEQLTTGQKQEAIRPRKTSLIASKMEREQCVIIPVVMRSELL